MTTGTVTSREQIVTNLKDLLRCQKQVKIDVDAVSMDTRLDRLGFDSLSILDFMYDVEDHFKIRIEIADLVRLERVQDLIDYLETRLGG
jgi:acyl carrier protein